MPQEYPYPSHVHAASFVSVKLSSKTNYSMWEEQMKCLLESHDMLGFIDGTIKKGKHRGWNRSDKLVKGWIFGSLSEDAMATVVGLDTANNVWEKLRATYATHSSPNIDKTDYLPLSRAIMRGDWEEAREIFNRDKDALTAKLNVKGQSALHIAVDACKHIQFVENLLKEINPESLLTLVSYNKINALHRAAMVDNTKAAKMLVEKNPYLLFSLDNMNSLPIHRAIIGSHETTFQYMLDACMHHIALSQEDGYHNPFEGRHGVKLLTNVINVGLLDVAYDLIKKYPAMVTENVGPFIPLLSIARKGDLYFSGTQYNFYQKFVYAHLPTGNNDLSDTNKIRDIENQDTYTGNFETNSWKTYFYYVIQRIYVKFWDVALLHVTHVKHLHEDKVKHNKAVMLLKCICKEVGKIDKGIDICQIYGEAFNQAVQNDTPEAVEEIMESFPQAIWTRNSDGYLATQAAIKDRCLKVHGVLIRHLPRNKYLVHAFLDDDKNNELHLAGQLAPMPKLNLVSGAALQMQRELQWFKGVEKFGKPKYKEAKNKRGETPVMVFRREHTQLRKEGEQWMKKTADSYTITAALIITIVFAAAITVPGGNDSDTGKAIYSRKPSFIIFVISDAISLFASTTSLLLFLSILTARYREEDFLYRLPLRLIVGLAMLFLSVSSMMVAFSATLYLTFGEGRAWILIPVATLTCLPIASFVTLQLPLLVDLISSTYYHGIFAGHQSW
ncbi:hypothetical protein Lser_V15G03368 [Lactuca serriola]